MRMSVRARVGVSVSVRVSVRERGRRREKKVKICEVVRKKKYGGTYNGLTIRNGMVGLFHHPSCGLKRGKSGTCGPSRGLLVIEAAVLSLIWYASGNTRSMGVGI